MPFNIKTVPVEIAVPQASTLLRFPFGQQQFLKEKEIVSIEVFTISDLLLSPINGYALPTKANFQSAYITLYGDNPENPGAYGDWIQQFPLLSFHRMVNGTDPYVFDQSWWIPRRISWEKSYIEIKAALGNAGAPVAWLLNVGYKGNAGDSPVYSPNTM